jgi:hypothetical protein
VHGLLSSHTTALPPPQLPLLQASPAVQASPSLQVAALGRLTQPVLGTQLSSVHGLLSSHTTALPPPQLPLLQASPAVQASPSLQVAALGRLTQPVPGTQLSSVHGLLSSHTTALPPPQLPLLQASPAVQASPSLQVAALGRLTQPVPGTQLSSVHRLLSSHVAAVPPAQLPPLQTSVAVHGSLSVQLAVLGRLTQPVWALQLSSVHRLLSSQLRAVPLAQAPLAQMSLAVQLSLSLQAAVLLAKMQPVALSQLSSVQGLLSSQSSGVPALQVPPAQTSSTVQTLSSVQGKVFGV